MYNYESKIFATNDLNDFLASYVSGAASEAASLELNVFEANSEDQIVNHIISTRHIEPLQLLRDQEERDFEEVEVDVWDYPMNRMLDEEFLSRPYYIPGFKITVKVPFTGTASLFKCKPSTRLMKTFIAKISENDSSLTITIELPQDVATKENIQQEIDNTLGSIQTMVTYINNDLIGYEDNLKTQTTAAVAKRKDALSKISDLKEALNIPIKKQANASPINQVKVKVNKIEPLAEKKEDPGAEISDEDYESILESIRSMGSSIETSRASESQDEETLRDVLLVGLNASIKNAVAGGELFRKNGKTDISIPFNNKAAFIAECKLWKGKVYIQEGIDQILGYTTWRDAKTSIVMFNKDNQDFSRIQDQMDDVFTTHPSFIKKQKSKSGEWRYVFHKPDDKGRLITIHVFLFDVYKSK